MFTNKMWIIKGWNSQNACPNSKWGKKPGQSDLGLGCLSMSLKLNNLLCSRSKMISSLVLPNISRRDFIFFCCKMIAEFKLSTSWINLQNGAKTLQLTTFSSLFTALQNKIELDISCESSTDRYFT